MARPTNREERRAQIVEGLRRSMAQHGYERATVALIAKEAGLAPGLVHYHFANKAEILIALVSGLAARADARIASRVADAASPLERVDAVVDALLGLGADHDRSAVQCWTLIACEAVKSTEVRDVYGAHVERLTDELARALVAACHAEGRSGEGARAIAGALVAQVEGYFLLAAAVPTVVPVGSAAEMAKRTVRGLLAGQPRKGR